MSANLLSLSIIDWSLLEHNSLSRTYAGAYDRRGAAAWRGRPLAIVLHAYMNGTRSPKLMGDRRPGHDGCRGEDLATTGVVARILIWPNLALLPASRLPRAWRATYGKSAGIYFR